MVVVNGEYAFFTVDIGSYCSHCDSGVFNNTKFAEKLENDRLDIPGPCTLPGDDARERMPFVFIWDEAFPLRTELKGKPEGSLMMK